MQKLRGRADVFQYLHGAHNIVLLSLRQQCLSSCVQVCQGLGRSGELGISCSMGRSYPDVCFRSIDARGSGT